MSNALIPQDTFHEALFAERERLGLTQSQLAEQLETSQQNVASWESGRSLPRARSLARLVAFFGPDSPVTKLAPTPKSAPRVSVSLVPPEGGPPVERDLADLWAQVVTDGQRSGPRQKPPSLASLLPAQFRRYVEPALRMGSREGRPDYWSPTVGLEMIWIYSGAPPLWVLQRARSAMQQLLVWNISHPAEPPRKLALVVVAEDAGAILQGSVLERITTESHLLNIEVVYTSAIDGVVHVVEQLEAGRPVVDDDH